MTDSSHHQSLSGYFDGELEPEDKADVAQRLEQSSDIRNELSEIEQLSNFLQELPAQTAPATLIPQVLNQIGAAQATATESRKPASDARHNTVLVVSLLATVAGLTVMLRPSAFRDQPYVELPGGSNPTAANAPAVIPESSTHAAVDKAELHVDVTSLLQACRTAGGDVVVIDATVADLPAAMRAISAWQNPSARRAATTEEGQRKDAGDWSSGIYLQAQPAELSRVLNTMAANPVWRRMDVRGVVDVASLQSDGLDLTTRSVNGFARATSRPAPTAADDQASAVSAGGSPAGVQLKYIPVRISSAKLAGVVRPRTTPALGGSRSPQPPSEGAALPARQKDLGEQPAPTKLDKNDAKPSTGGALLRVVLVLRTQTSGPPSGQPIPPDRPKSKR